MDSVASVWMVGMLLATAVVIVLAWMCYDLKVKALGRDSPPPPPKPLELGDDDTHI
jgi:hypothetical protein